MARFFFHFRDDREFVEDLEGQDVADLATAHERGVAALREILAGDVANGLLNMSSAIDIENEHHAAVASIECSEVLKVRS